jgi:Tripartite ATP-independent periplasmic transporter, DctM component
MTLALFVVPVALLLFGFPIFMVLLTAVTVALVFFMHVPLVVVHQNLFGSVNATPLLAVPFFICAGELMGRRHYPRQSWRDGGGHLSDLRRDLGRERRNRCDRRQGHGAGNAPRGLPGALHGRPHHRSRRHRHNHPTQHPNDRLWRRG